MAGEKELLPPPPKKEASIETEEVLLPPPPKKKSANPKWSRFTQWLRECPIKFRSPIYFE